MKKVITYTFLVIFLALVLWTAWANTALELNICQIQLTGLPEDFEVEVPALCSADGIHPISTTALPKHMIAHILRDRVAPVEMELEAYEKGNLDYLKELVLMDKWATSMEQVSAFIDEIMALPYHEEMRNHYR